MTNALESQGAVLIHGATGGVGAALARRLRQDGLLPFLAGRKAAALANLAAELDTGHCTCDVLNSQELEQAAARAAGEDEVLAGLAFCVGSIQLGALRRQSRDSLRAAIELNAVSAIEAVRVAEPFLKKGRGSVVLFSTIAVAQGFTNHAAISAAKGAVEGATRALAADLAPHVRVNAIAPSLLRTGMAEPLIANDATATAIAQLHPMPRLGTPEDAAALAAFLLKPESGWITGQVFAVDGGRSRVRLKG